MPRMRALYMLYYVSALVADATVSERLCTVAIIDTVPGELIMTALSAPPNLPAPVRSLRFAAGPPHLTGIARLPLPPPACGVQSNS